MRWERENEDEDGMEDGEGGEEIPYQILPELW